MYSLFTCIYRISSHRKTNKSSAAEKSKIPAAPETAQACVVRPTETGAPNTIIGPDPLHQIDGKSEHSKRLRRLNGGSLYDSPHGQVSPRGRLPASLPSQAHIVRSPNHYGPANASLQQQTEANPGTLQRLPGFSTRYPNTRYTHVFGWGWCRRACPRSPY